MSSGYVIIICTGILSDSDAAGLLNKRKKEWGVQMKKINNRYGNESIMALKGADRVRLRPSAIFGSDGIEGCQQAFFEIL